MAKSVHNSRTGKLVLHYENHVFTHRHTAKSGGQVKWLCNQKGCNAMIRTQRSHDTDHQVVDKINEHTCNKETDFSTVQASEALWQMKQVRKTIDCSNKIIIDSFKRTLDENVKKALPKHIGQVLRKALAKKVVKVEEAPIDSIQVVKKVKLNPKKKSVTGRVSKQKVSKSQPAGLESDQTMLYHQDIGPAAATTHSQELNHQFSIGGYPVTIVNAYEPSYIEQTTFHDHHPGSKIYYVQAEGTVDQNSVPLQAQYYSQY